MTKTKVYVWRHIYTGERFEIVAADRYEAETWLALDVSPSACEYLGVKGEPRIAP